jgi:hypothetical protein
MALIKRTKLMRPLTLGTTVVMFSLLNFEIRQHCLLAVEVSGRKLLMLRERLTDCSPMTGDFSGQMKHNGKQISRHYMMLPLPEAILPRQSIECSQILDNPQGELEGETKNSNSGM